jgi:glyoxylase-like metal-dependent hydrolase (beta-lactamase superfamily II)
MKLHNLGVAVSVAALAVAAWLGDRGGAERKPAPAWTEVLPGIWRSPGQPAGYALVSGSRALLIDAPAGPEGLKARGVKTIDAVLLTHHHRDGLAALGHYLDAKVRIRAPKASAPWLTPDGVRKYWIESLPLRNSRTAYLVLPEGHAGIDCSVNDGDTIDWQGWSIRVVSTPGHSPDSVAFAVRKGGAGPLWVFSGDAIAAAGKLWSPYTTDWDHWTDAGLKPAAQSLRKLARLRPAALLPAHGEVIARTVKSRGVVRALEQTAKAVDEVGFLKSYERYTRERVQDPPRYAFLAKEQAGTNGSKPWSRISQNLWLTGNTYVLVSRDGPCLVVDPWDPHSAKQVPKLQGDQKLGKVEVVLASHAHFDHYDGAYALLARDRPQVWTLDRVATPIADPYLLRAPFLDARPVPVSKRLTDGQTARWREYTFKFHFLPGQTEYTMGVETTIDGKRCLFTGDNFFHHDLYSGTGGWMGLNRSGPALYETSARKVLALAPDWVLAEHGSAMEFSAADFRRRVEWARVSARAADALCVSGNHRHDWNPHHVRLEPILQKARPGQTVKATLVVDNVLPRPRKLSVTLEGRGRTPDQTWTVEVGPGGTVRRPVSIALAEKLEAGRVVLALAARAGEVAEPGDAFVVVEVDR